MSRLKWKKALLEQMMGRLQERIENAERDVVSARESRDSDTKSSAGDKHETGRAMMQRELENYEVQLDKVISLKNQLSRVDLKEERSKVQFGSLVFTNQGNYFISIGLGKVTSGNIDYYAISITSPIGQALQNKTSGDQAIFQEREILIEEVV